MGYQYFATLELLFSISKSFWQFLLRVITSSLNIFVHQTLFQIFIYFYFTKTTSEAKRERRYAAGALKFIRRALSIIFDLGISKNTSVSRSRESESIHVNRYRCYFSVSPFHRGPFTSIRSYCSSPMKFYISRRNRT